MTFQSSDRSHEAVVTIGVFDGVHVGHRALIGRVVERAKQLGIESGCVTFDPHPQEVLRPGMEIAHLATLSDRIAMIKGLGVSEVLLIEFTRSLARMSPEEFIELLLERFLLRELWIGSNFALGRNRAGTPDRLAVIGRAKGFDVMSFPRVERGGQMVSSSRIRRLLADGRVEQAAELLGRHYRLRGRVVSGDGRGRSLGFATANLAVLERLCVPQDGVYAVRCWLEGVEPFPAVCNIGVRPTFDGDRKQVEVHLIGFEGDLYGQEMAVEFVTRLRGERRFPSMEALIAQISEDVKRAKVVLSRASSPSY